MSYLSVSSPTRQGVLLLLCFGLNVAVMAQSPTKTRPTQTEQDVFSVEALRNSIQLEEARQALPVRSLAARQRAPLARPVVPPVGQTFRTQAHPQTGLPDWVQLSPVDAPPAAQCQQWFQTLAPAWGLDKAEEAFELRHQRRDRDGDLHLHWQQVYRGVPCYGNEVKAHFEGEQLVLVNGRVFPETELNTSPTLTPEEAIAHAQAELAKEEPLHNLSPAQLKYLGRAQYEVELIIFQDWPAAARLAYAIEATPNLAAHYYLMVDAHSGEVLQSRDHLCHLLPPNVTTATDLAARAGRYTLIG
jgi:hypothetical protein